MFFVNLSEFVNFGWWSPLWCALFDCEIEFILDDCLFHRVPLPKWYHKQLMV